MRSALGIFPTPLQPLRGAESIVPGATCDLLVKRDDLTGFAVAGNKARPLEFLLADALHSRAEVVVGAGAPSSNFIAALAEAAAIVGLGCELLVPRPVVESASVQLARIAGASIVPVEVSRHELDAAVHEHAMTLSRSGRAAYAVPRGGATPVGAMGFARAAHEVMLQLGNRRDVTIVLPVGSGASVAGLLAGLREAGSASSAYSVVGVSVSRPLHGLREHLEDLARGCLAAMDAEPGAGLCDRLTLMDRTDGIGARDVEVARAMLVSAGLVMDDHYGMPTAAAAVDVARDLHGGTVVLWHTGGIAGLPGVLSRLAPAESRERAVTA